MNVPESTSREELEEGEIEEDEEVEKKSLLRSGKKDLAHEYVRSERENFGNVRNVPNRQHDSSFNIYTDPPLSVYNVPQKDVKDSNIRTFKSQHQDGSFWGPIDYVEKQKTFKRRFTWFNNPKNHSSIDKSNNRRHSSGSNIDLIKEEINSSSFEELLEQYKDVQCKLKHINHKPRNKSSHSKGEEKRVDNSKKHPSTNIKNRRRRSRRAALRVKNPGADTLKISNHENIVLKETCGREKDDHEDEDELELRRIALQSTIKSNEELPPKVEAIPVKSGGSEQIFLPVLEVKRNLSRCLRQIPLVNFNTVQQSEYIIDNYETVEMDLDSENSDQENNVNMDKIQLPESAPEIKPKDKKSSLPPTETESIELKDFIIEEDEEILRAKLLVSLANNDKANIKVHLDVKESPETLINGVVAIKSTVPKPKPQLIVPPLKNPQTRVIITLGEDSSESETEEAVTSPHKQPTNLSDNIASFIKQAKDMSGNNNLKATPKAVYQLSRSQQLEYHLLKAEIAKREGSKSNETASKKSAEASKAALEYKLARMVLNKAKLSLQQNEIKVLEEESRLKILKSQLNKTKLDQKSAEAKVQLLKIHLLNAEKLSHTYKAKLHKLSSEISTCQLSLKNKLKEESAINAKLINLSRDCVTKSSLIPGQRKRTASLKSSTKAKKSKVSESCVDINSNMKKTQLLNLEREIAAKLVSMRQNIGPDLPKQKPKANKKVENKRLSFHDIDPSTAPKLNDEEITAIVPESNNSERYNSVIKILNEEKMSLLKKIADNKFSVKARNRVELSPMKIFNIKRTQKHQNLKRYRQYVSPLVVLRSYRLSPFYKTTLKSHSSLTTSNTVDSAKILCRFDVTGICNDEQCQWQHQSDYKMSTNQLLIDLVSHALPVAGVNDSWEEKVYETRLGQFVKSVLGVSELSDVGSDDYCAILIDHLNKKRTRDNAQYVVTEPRKWKPKSNSRTTMKKNENASDDKTDYVLNTQISPNDVDPRYFISDDDSIVNMEAAVMEDKNNIDLWIKLANHQLHNKSRDKPIERALNALSIGLEHNQSSSVLWTRYLDIYSHWSKDDYPNACKRAVHYTSSYIVWRRYLDATKEFSQKYSIANDIIAFLKTSGESNSSSIIDIIIYRTKLAFITGRNKLALQSLQEPLGIKKSSQSLVDYLTISDCCFLWLCFIHMSEFGNLPLVIFDSNDDASLCVVQKTCIVLNWFRHKKLQVGFECLLDHFKTALNHCHKKSLHSWFVIKECLPLYMNLINLEIHRDGYRAAINVCRQLLDVCPSSPQIWTYLICIEAGYLQVVDITHPPLIRITNYETLFFYPEISPHVLKNASGDDVTAKILSVFQEASSKVKDLAPIVHLVATYFLYDFERCKNLLLDFAFTINKNIQNIDDAISYLSKILNSKPSSDLQTISIAPTTSNVCDPQNENKSQCQNSYSNVYLWLNYCYLMEVACKSPADIIKSYEAAIWSNFESSNLEKIWCQYFNYLYRNEIHKDHWDIDLIKRCLITLPVNKANKAHFRQDFTFHNQIIDMLMKSLEDGELKGKLHHNLVSLFPANVELVNRSFRYFLSVQDLGSASYICTFYSSKNIPSVAFWKMAVRLGYHNSDEVEMIRKTMKNATKALPYSTSLWKDFVLFELSTGSSSHISTTMKMCSDYGLDMEEFLHFLMEKHSLGKSQ